MVEFDVSADVKRAAGVMTENADAVEEAGEATVDELASRAERAMKRHAPEGTGYPSVHLRDTIKTEKKMGGRKAEIMPHKKSSDGWLLHKAIVGNPSTPSYGDLPPPIEPLRIWAAAKLGDPSIGWKLQNSIQEDGQESFPNRFIDDSIGDWSRSIQTVATSEVMERL